MAESDFEMMKKDLIEGMKKDKWLTLAMAGLYLVFMAGFVMGFMGLDNELVNLTGGIGIVGFGWAFIVAAVFKRYHIFFWHALLFASLIVVSLLAPALGL